jgi:hypothetical protein
MYGLRVKHKDTKRVMEFWFDDKENRERNKKMFDPYFYEFEYFSNDQSELNFE